MDVVAVGVIIVVAEVVVFVLEGLEPHLEAHLRPLAPDFLHS